jgi:hypothetical protein
MFARFLCAEKRQEERLHFHYGLAAVADGVLFGWAKLGDGAGKRGDEEHGVVAEAVLALLSVDDEAFKGSLSFCKDLPRAGQTERADESASSLFSGSIFQQTKQLSDIAMVDEGTGLAIEFGSGEAGTVDTGGTVQGINHEAGIVGNGPEACGGCVAEGLFAGVLGEGGAILFDFRGHGKIGKGKPLNIGIEHGGKLGHLAAIGCCYEDLHKIFATENTEKTQSKTSTQINADSRRLQEELETLIARITLIQKKIPNVKARNPKQIRRL